MFARVSSAWTSSPLTIRSRIFLLANEYRSAALILRLFSVLRTRLNPNNRLRLCCMVSCGTRRPTM